MAHWCRRISRTLLAAFFVLAWMAPSQASAGVFMVTAESDWYFSTYDDATTLTFYGNSNRSCQQAGADPYLWLYDSADVLIAQDDDGGHNWDTQCVSSRMTVTLPMGDYRLRTGYCCSSRGLGYEGGAYEVAVDTELSTDSGTTTTWTSTSTSTTTSTTQPDTTTSTSTTLPITTSTSTTTSSSTTTVPAPTSTISTTSSTTTTTTTTTSTLPPTTTSTTSTTVPATTTLPIPPTTITTTTLSTTTSTASPTSSTSVVTSAPSTSLNLPSSTVLVAPTTSTTTSTSTTTTTATTTSTSTSTTTAPPTTLAPVTSTIPIVEQPAPDAPIEVRQEFEQTVDIYSGEFDDYVPIGSTITVGQRRVIIAATTVVIIAPVSTSGRGSKGKGK